MSSAYFMSYSKLYYTIYTYNTAVLLYKRFNIMVINSFTFSVLICKTLPHTTLASHWATVLSDCISNEIKPTVTYIILLLLICCSTQFLTKTYVQTHLDNSDQPQTAHCFGIVQLSHSVTGKDTLLISTDEVL